MKKLIGIVGTIMLVMSLFSAAYAADEVIYEGGFTETKSEAKDLDGWGKEIFTKCIFEADVQFKELGSGITLRSADNMRGGTSIRAVDRNGVYTLAADGGTGAYFIYYIPLDPDTWYHIKLIGNYGVQNGMVDMVVDTYDKDKNIIDTKNYYVILMNEMYASSGVGPEHIRVEAGTCVDNVKVTEMKPDSIKLSIPSNTVTPGSKVDISAKTYRDGSAFQYDCEILYKVSGTGVTVSEDGILSVAENAPEQAFTVEAVSGDMKDIVEMKVASGDVFTVTSAVFDKDYKALEEIRAVKNYYYNDEAVFVVTVYDGSGVLKEAFIKNVPSGAVTVGEESSIMLGYTLPQEFDMSSWQIEIRSWSASGKTSVEFVSDGSIPIRKVFEENGGAVEWLADRSTVVGMMNGKTAVLQVGNGRAYIEDAVIEMKNVPYIVDGSTYVDSEIISSMAA